MSDLESTLITENQEWFYELDGKQIGPLSARQIQELYLGKLIGPEQAVTSARLAGKVESISVAELNGYLHEKPPTEAAVIPAPQNTGPFNPPPRPIEVNEPGPVITFSQSHISADPSFALYEAYQASRDKKHPHKFTPPPAQEIFRSETVSAIREQLTPRILLLMGAGLVMLAGAVSLVRWIAGQATPSPSSATPPAASRPHVPPPARSSITSPSIQSRASFHAPPPQAPTLPATPERELRDHPSERGEVPMERPVETQENDAQAQIQALQTEPPEGHFQPGNPSVMNDGEATPQTPPLGDPNAANDPAGVQQP